MLLSAPSNACVRLNQCAGFNCSSTCYTWICHHMADKGVSGLQRSKALLATCYMHCDEHYRVPKLLQGCKDDQCRYLLATCLVKLPGKLQEARAVLLPGYDRSKVSQASPIYVPHLNCSPSGRA